MTELADLGVTGLAVMGANLARNAARKGLRVALHNRTDEKTDRLVAEHGGEGDFRPSHSVADFVASLATPRVVIIMVKAGKPVDGVIDALKPHLEPGDSWELTDAAGGALPSLDHPVLAGSVSVAAEGAAPLRPSDDTHDPDDGSQVDDADESPEAVPVSVPPVSESPESKPSEYSPSTV